VRAYGAVVNEAELGIRRLVVEHPYMQDPEWERSMTPSTSAVPGTRILSSFEALRRRLAEAILAINP
jgi:hypothetical protein